MTRGFVYINDLYNPFMYVLYVEQSILQTVKNLTLVFWAVGKISNLSFHNPSASHKIILLKLWLSLMCGFQVWQHGSASIVQLMQQ